MVAVDARSYLREVLMFDKSSYTNINQQSMVCEIKKIESHDICRATYRRIVNYEMLKIAVACLLLYNRASTRYKTKFDDTSTPREMTDERSSLYPSKKSNIRKYDYTTALSEISIIGML